jgi:hypothetical protein
MHLHEVQPETYLAARSVDAPLPWSFIQTGTSTSHLLRQWERARGHLGDQSSSREADIANS